MAVQRHEPIEKRASNCFVHRVVASDILTGNFQFAVHVENSGSMNSARVREITLRVAQFFRKRKQRFDIDPESCRSYGGEILPDRLNTRLAAKTATAGNCPETLRCVQFCFYAVRKLDDDSVVRAEGQVCDVVGISHNA